MAKIIGNIKNIKKEEQVILNLISNNLNEEYYIFYKPFLNGEIPDVVILKRHGGICIINISYINPKYILGVNNKENSVILNNNNKIKNPIKKINEQKYNMFNYHIESLNKAKIKCEGALALVQPFIVFVNGIKRNIDKYFRDKYVSMYGLDEMQKLVNDIKIKSNRSSKYFTDEMFNESYSMTLNYIIVALEKAGLDPFLGFLHSVKYGREALALDLLEEFRQGFCDKFVIKMINRREVKKSDFFKSEELGVRFTEIAFRKYLKSF